MANKHCPRCGRLLKGIPELVPYPDWLVCECGEFEHECEKPLPMPSWALPPEPYSPVAECYTTYN